LTNPTMMEHAPTQQRPARPDTEVDLRQKIEVADKKNIVPAGTLVSFDAAIPTLARLQTHEASIKILVKTYGLKVPDSLLGKLQAKTIETLADLRSAGGAEVLAKALKVKADDPHLETLVAHAHLSLLGTDVGANATAIKEGYSRISAIAYSPEGVFMAKVGPTIGFETALRMKRVATAQWSIMQNQVTDLLARQA